MIDTLWEWLIVAGAVLAVVVGLGVAFLRPGRGAPERQLPTPPKPEPSGDEGAGGGGGVLAPPRPTPTPPVPSTPTAPPVEEDVFVEDVLDTPVLDRPDTAVGRLQRLRARLARSNTALGKGLLNLLTRGGLDETVWEEVEDTLISADLGIEASTELVEALRTQVKVAGTRDEASVRSWLKQDLLRLVDPRMDRAIASSRIGDRPAVVLVVGVNGTGKTTTVGKLARVLVSEDKDVLLGAADTFRAAAADQLETWGARVGVPTVRSARDGADPAAVALDAVKAGIENEVDVVLLDTAGGLCPGRRHHRHRLDQARRDGQGRHRRSGAAQARCPGQACRPRRRPG